MPQLMLLAALAGAAAVSRKKVTMYTGRSWKYVFYGNRRPHLKFDNGVDWNNPELCARSLSRYKTRWRHPDMLYNQKAVYGTGHRRSTKREHRWMFWRMNLNRNRVFIGKKLRKIAFIRYARLKDQRFMDSNPFFDWRHMGTWMKMDRFREQVGGIQYVRLEKQREYLGFPCPPVRLGDHCFKILEQERASLKRAEEEGKKIEMDMRDEKGRPLKLPRALGTVNQERRQKKALKAAKKMR